MRKVKRAIGYVCDVPIPGTDQVIGKEDQRMRLMKYAQKENIEVVAVFEDNEYTDDVMNRPGVKDMVNCGNPCEMVLVERIWAINRKRKNVDPFLKWADIRGVELVASSYLWDCVSQQVRHRYATSIAEKARAELKAKLAAKDMRGAA